MGSTGSMIFLVSTIHPPIHPPIRLILVGSFGLRKNNLIIKWVRKNCLLDSEIHNSYHFLLFEIYIISHPRRYIICWAFLLQRLNTATGGTRLFLVHSNGFSINPSVANYCYSNKDHARNSNYIGIFTVRQDQFFFN